MKQLILLLSAFAGPFLAPAQSPDSGALPPAGSPNRPYFQQRVDYRIEVTLDDKNRSLDGFITLQYTNHSPDTLSFIWMHCWPNAYKNDRSAFSEQLLGNGRTDFYFSTQQQRGYINRLDFRVDGLEARMEDHPQYIDVIKVILPRPLPPEGHVTLTTPFHVRLPFNFSRGGYTLSGSRAALSGSGAALARRPGSSLRAPVEPVAPPLASYQITQWYPKPAVYDNRGWHPLPYLDQGEFYSEFGDFDVRITVPKAFVVAATGRLTDSSLTASTRTLHYEQSRIHDFAWFADRRFLTRHDTLQLPSGRIIDVYAYYTPREARAWSKSTDYIKRAVLFRSALIGEYPFDVVTAVQTKMGSTGGMEYPTITAINLDGTPKDLDLTIEHEVGHNWFYAVLGSNERRYPWMDEGINTYYDDRYEALYYPAADNSRVIADIDTRAVEHTDQPMATASEDFTESNYYNIAYNKTAAWMRMLQDSLGVPLFDSCMRTYFRTWQFKHPYPEDFRSVIKRTSKRCLDTLFSLPGKTGALPPMPAHRRIRPALVFSLEHTDSVQYLSFSPAFSYNIYDRVMVGALIHNFNLPPAPWQFFLLPLYATNSRQLNGAGALMRTFYPDDGLQKVRVMVGGARFSSDSGVDSNGHRLFGGYYKIAPSIRLVLKNGVARSTVERSVEWKTFLIGEKNLDNYVLKSTDSLAYPTAGKYRFRYLNQLSLQIRDDRVLYPYKALLQLQQASHFYRADLVLDYFFNYAKGGGLDFRLFGSKFGYLGSRYAGEDLTRYEPKLTGVRGNEDYTYSNWFIGRNAFDGGPSQQIMDRDGNLPLRTDLFQDLQGRSDNWVAAVNFRSTLPRALVPEWLPVKAFFNAGTYAGAWSDNPATSRFLYAGGFELDLAADVIRVYIPLVYSSDFSSQLKTVPDQNTFLKKLSFSISLQNIDFRKLFGNMPF
ncbi:MAG TPA: M1 family metallopeptidase [Puia sp.]|nr:M1 family metallopeptidase [Puia sp.]